MDKKYTSEYFAFLASGYYEETLTPEQLTQFEAWYELQCHGSFGHSQSKYPWRVRRRNLEKIFESINGE